MTLCAGVWLVGFTSITTFASPFLDSRRPVVYGLSVRACPVPSIVSHAVLHAGSAHVSCAAFSTAPSSLTVQASMLCRSGRVGTFSARSWITSVTSASPGAWPVSWLPSTASGCGCGWTTWIPSPGCVRRPARRLINRCTKASMFAAGPASGRVPSRPMSSSRRSPATCRRPISTPWPRAGGASSG